MTGAGLMISGLLQFSSFNQYLTKNYFGNSDLSIWVTISTYAPMVALILFMTIGKDHLERRHGVLLLFLYGLFMAGNCISALMR